MQMPITEFAARSAMGEADNALREEIEKVRERARLQALAQGIGPDAAAQQGNQAVEEFCSRWGIRPDMVGPASGRGLRPGAPAGPPPREEARKVDLGASPLRNAANPGQTQAIRIADLLKRAKEAEAAAVRPAAPAPAVTADLGGRTATNLSSLLQRMRTADPSRPAPAPAKTVASPTVATPPAPRMPSPAAPPGTGTVPRVLSTSDVFAGGATLSSNAERRRQVLEEFDRTYAEVQTMLEQRIGVVDIALNDASKGLTGAMARAQAGGLQPHEIETLAEDVNRLRQNLTTMMQTCDEFLRHMERITASKGGR
jgi:hypothetical protein